MCTVDNYENGTYACYRDDGKIYKPGNLGKDRGTDSGPPFAVGTFRFLVGVDRLIASTFLLGLRAGYALNGGPAVPSSSGEKKFFPFHAELRATYFIGKDSLTKTGVRPFVFVSGGAAQVDAKVAGVPVSNDCDANTADQPACSCSTALSFFISAISSSICLSLERICSSTARASCMRFLLASQRGEAGTISMPMPSRIAGTAEMASMVRHTEGESDKYASSALST